MPSPPTAKRPKPKPRATAQRVDRWLQWLPAATTIILSIPVFLLPFLWDDFDFLARAQTLRLRDLLPATTETLYRPLSREVYFSLVNLLGRGSPLVAHAMNAALAASCCLLLVSFIRRFSGTRAGIIGGFIFSAAAGVPLLVGWISGSQDLLCILFALGSYLLLASGRVVLGTLLFGAALFSKETAAALMPAMLAVTVLAAPRSPGRVLKASALFIAVLGVWAMVHPWTHRLMTHKEAGDVNQYVSFRGTGTLGGLIRGLPSLFNVSPASGHAWHIGIIASALLASGVVALGIRQAWLTRSEEVAVTPRNQNLLPIVGVLTTAGPFLLTSAFIAHWSVYYAGISAVGIAMIVAPFLSRASWLVATLFVTMFLWMGVISRMAVVAPEVPAEQNLRAIAPGLQRIQREIKSLQPDLPHEAGVYVYIQAPGTHGAYDSIYKNQPLKVWYKDSSIEVRDPLHLLPRGREEFLFWISTQLDVFEIDPNTLQARSPGPAAAFPEYQKTLRAFALGLAGRGETDRAVSILTGMLQFSDYLKAYDRRSAAALLYAAGRNGEADRLLTTTTPFARKDAISEVAGLIAKPIPGLALDQGAFRAFGLAPADTTAWRDIMSSLERGGYHESASRVARRLLILVPGDLEATRLLGRTQS